MFASQIDFYFSTINEDFDIPWTFVDHHNKEMGPLSEDSEISEIMQSTVVVDVVDLISLLEVRYEEYLTRLEKRRRSMPTFAKQECSPPESPRKSGNKNLEHPQMHYVDEMDISRLEEVSKPVKDSKYFLEQSLFENIKTYSNPIMNPIAVSVPVAVDEPPGRSSCIASILKIFNNLFGRQKAQ